MIFPHSSPQYKQVILMTTIYSMFGLFDFVWFIEFWFSIFFILIIVTFLGSSQYAALVRASGHSQYPDHPDSGQLPGLPQHYFDVPDTPPSPLSRSGSRPSYAPGRPAHFDVPLDKTNDFDFTSLLPRPGLNETPDRETSPFEAKSDSCVCPLEEGCCL